MSNMNELSISGPQNLLALPQKKSRVVVPDWITAQHLVFPFLEPVSIVSGKIADIAAKNPFDALSGMLANGIKMTITLFYRGAIIPLTETLIREWEVSFAAVHLAMDANMSLVARSSRLEAHSRGSFQYYSVHSDASPFNSALPFYAPFQESVAALLGIPFYFAVPERRTVILFGKESLPRYREELRNDILLTRDASTSALSSELIEVSASGALPVGL